jgi:hypothetical protein
VNNGQLGDNTLTQSSSVPVLVGGGFASVAAGFGQSFGLRTDGTLFSWGWNDSGQLGDGAAPKVPQLTPRRISTDRPNYLVYPLPVVSYPSGAAISPATPTVAGGQVQGLSISPPLPAGLTFDTTTGAVSGTPAAPSPRTTYAITATGLGGSTTALLTITVN